MGYFLQIGAGLIDLENPQPEQMDLPAIDERLSHIQRFSNDPTAFAVRTHVELAEELAIRADAPPDVRLWVRHHDDHEGIMGDWPGPIKKLISLHTPVVDHLEERLDRTLCLARGIDYPSEETRRVVHYFDKLAETLEWRWKMKRPAMWWNMRLPDWLNEMTAENMVEAAQAGLYARAL